MPGGLNECQASQVDAGVEKQQSELTPACDMTDSEGDLLGKLSTRFVIYTAYASPFLYY